MPSVDLSIPSSLLPLYLSNSEFQQRFQLTAQTQDPYVRAYILAIDKQNSQGKIIMKQYNASTQDEINDVLQNLQNFRRLGDMEGMCGLVSFTKSQQIITAAFQFGQITLEELIESRKFDQNRRDLYLLILKQLLGIIEQVTEQGIAVEELITSSIVMQHNDGQYVIKMLYEERQKKYDKIIQGIKVFASAQHITRGLRQQNQQQQKYIQSIFQLGLLMLDTIYQYQSQTVPINVFSKDQPLRQAPPHKSYLLFEDSQTVELNRDLIKRKIEYLKRLNYGWLDQMCILIEGMVDQQGKRMKISNVVKSIQKIEKTMIQAKRHDIQRSQEKRTQVFQGSFAVVSQTIVKKQSKQIQREINRRQEVFQTPQDSFSTPTKLTPSKPILPPQPSPSQNFKKNPIASFTTLQTQIASPNKSVIIPREQLLGKIKTNSTILQKLSVILDQISTKGTLIKKQYFDSSVYWGQISPTSQKRSGLGVYLYVQGDLYFGKWSQNSLIEGNYIFRNGQSFQGCVKNGKQGFGRYHYANGNIYEGDWVNDVKHGQGSMQYSNGDRYEGSWSKGKKTGSGKYFYHNGTKYDGSFNNGKKEGFGVITFPNGTKVEAYWKQTCIQGPGKVFYSNGDYFQGMYHQSQKQGKGLYIWQGQSANYDGQFNKDSMQGHARVRFSQKQYYQGKIVNGKREGKGLYHYTNGDVFEGDWKGDRKLIGRYRFDGGSWFQGRFKDGQMNYGIMKYENGQIYQGQFSDGQRNGIGVYKSVNGEIVYDGRWKDDKFLGNI